MYSKVLLMAVILVMTLVIPTAYAADTNTVSSTVVTDKAPPTASAPAVVVNNNDVCKSAYSAAIQTQIFGVATGITVRDENCERIKLSRSLYGMGMKVAAVSTLCQDARVFDAMIMAGTPCPYKGKIGKDAHEAWGDNPDDVPSGSRYYEETPPPPPPPEPEPEPVEEDDDGSFIDKILFSKEIPSFCDGYNKYTYNRDGRRLDWRCREETPRQPQVEETDDTSEPAAEEGSLTFEIIEESFTPKEEPEEVAEPEVTVEELPEP
jgi:hypothetical protein